MSLDHLIYETESLLQALEGQEPDPHPLTNLRAATAEVTAIEKQQFFLEYRTLARLLKEHVTLDMMRDSLRKWASELRAGRNPFAME